MQPNTTPSYTEQLQTPAMSVEEVHQYSLKLTLLRRGYLNRDDQMTHQEFQVPKMEGFNLHLLFGVFLGRIRYRFQVFGEMTHQKLGSDPPKLDLILEEWWTVRTRLLMKGLSLRDVPCLAQGIQYEFHGTW